MGPSAAFFCIKSRFKGISSLFDRIFLAQGCRWNKRFTNRQNQFSLVVAKVMTSKMRRRGCRNRRFRMTYNVSKIYPSSGTHDCALSHDIITLGIIEPVNMNQGSLKKKMQMSPCKNQVSKNAYADGQRRNLTCSQHPL